MTRRILTFLLCALVLLPGGCNLGSSTGEGGGTEGKGLTGILTDPQDRPVVNAVVRAYLPVDSAAALAKGGTAGLAAGSAGVGAPPVDSAVTDGKGRYDFPDLAAGKYNLESEHWSAGVFLGRFESAVAYAGGRKDRGRAALQVPGALRIRVAWDEWPVPGALCRIPGSSFSALSDASGDCTFARVPPGSFRVHAVREGFLAAISSPVNIVSGGTAAGGTVRLRDDANLPGLAGRLRDTAGRPLEGVRVRAYAEGAVEAGVPAVDSALTDAFGRYRLLNLPPGRYNLEAYLWQGGGEVGTFSPGVAFSGTLYRSPDTLRPPGHIRLRVHSQGFPVRGARCYLPATPFAGVSEDSGRCVLTRVPAGRYKVQVRDPRYLPAESDSVVVAPGDTTDAGEVDLSEATAPTGLKGTLVDSSGAALTGARVAAFSPNDTTGAALDSAITDARGRYRLGNLNSGTYNIEANIWKGGTLAGYFPGSVFSGDLDRGTDTLRPPASLRLTIRSLGTALPGTLCRIPASSFRTSGNDTGACIFANVPAGRFRIEARRANYAAASTDTVALAPGAATDAGVLDLGAPLQVGVPVPKVQYFDTTAGTVALWTFNAAVNNRFADAGHNQFGLSAEGHAVETSLYGSALVANGATTLLSISHDSLLSVATTAGLTYEARLFANAWPTGRPATLFGMGGGFKVQLDPDGALRAVITKTGARGLHREEYVSAPGALPIGSWKDLAVAFDATVSPHRVYAWIDSQAVPLQGYPDNDSVYAYATDKFVIANNEEKTEGFTGKFDEIRVSRSLPRGVGASMQPPASESGRHFSLTPSTVALWSFNSAEHGLVPDAGPNKFDLTATVTLPLQSSPYRRALPLNTVNPGLSTTFDSALTPAKTGRITYEARIWLNAYPTNVHTAYPPLMGTPGGFEMQVGADGTLRAKLPNALGGWADFSAATAANVVPLNQWVNLAVAVDYTVTPRQFYAYVNGNPVQLYTTDVLGAYATPAVPFSVTYSPDGVGAFDGKVDELRISNDLALGAGLSLTDSAPPEVPVLLAGFTFDEGTGDTAIAGGTLGLKAVTAFGDPVRWTAGAISSAIAIDPTQSNGSQGRLNVNDTALRKLWSTPSLTLEIWAKLQGTGMRRGIASLNPTVPPSYPVLDFGVDENGRLYGKLYGSTGSDEFPVSDRSVTPGEWTHCALVYTGDSAKLFLNGAVAYAGSSMNQPFNALAGTPTPSLRIGMSTSPGSQIDNPWSGSLDELRIYSGALTDAQIMQRYLDSKPAPEPPLAKPAISYPVDTLRAIVGQSITPVSPVSTGGTVASYASAPAMFTGMSVDPVTGVISGTPAQPFPSGADFRIIATNTAGNDTDTVHIMIADTAMPPLLAGFSFDEGTGDSVFSQGTLIVKAYRGLNPDAISFTEWTPGVSGTALSFNDTIVRNETVPLVFSQGTTPALTGFDRFTVETWAIADRPIPWTPNTVKVTRGLAGVWLDPMGASVHDNPTRNAWLFGVDPDSRLVLRVYSDSMVPGTEIQPRYFLDTTAKSNTVVPTGTWVHLAGVFSTDSIRLYINGQQVCAAPSMGLKMRSVSESSTERRRFLIGTGGASGSAGTVAWPGRLDELRIYSGALTDAQVMQRYLATKP